MLWLMNNRDLPLRLSSFLYSSVERCVGLFIRLCTGHSPTLFWWQKDRYNMRTLLSLLSVCIVCLACFYILQATGIEKSKPKLKRLNDKQAWSHPNLESEHEHTNDTPALLEREKLYLEFLDEARAIDEARGNESRTKRFPDVINIGVEKCGTGFLREILRRHPKFLFPKSAESHFFTYKWQQGYKADDYRQEMPESAPYHIVIEKTPSYFNFGSKTVPERMKSVVPNVTLIVVLCDPVNRTISDFVHEIIMNNIPKGTDFNTFMPRIIDANKFILDFHKHDDKVIEYIYRGLQRDLNYHLMSTALYYYHLIRWFNVFDRNQVYIINGEELIENPGKVAEDLQDYLRVPKLIIKEDFERGPGGFYCIHTPKLEEKMGKRRVVRPQLECLNKAAKGRTRFGDNPVQHSTEILAELREFFQPFNEKLYKLLGRRFQWQ